MQFPDIAIWVYLATLCKSFISNLISKSHAIDAVVPAILNLALLVQCTLRHPNTMHSVQLVQSPHRCVVLCLSFSRAIFLKKTLLGPAFFLSALLALFRCSMYAMS